MMAEVKRARRYSAEQAAVLVECGKAAQVLGLTQEVAAARAEELLGVSVSARSIGNALSGAVPALRAPESPAPKACATLFEYATEGALEGIMERLDEIIRIIRGVN